MNSNYILFTGAGFTYNFGAPLALEFNNYLYPYFKDDEYLKAKLSELSLANFEDFYNWAINSSELKEDQKKLVKNSFIKAFQELNNTFEKLSDIQKKHINNFKKHVLESLSAKEGDFFTLNQDNFIELHMDEFNGKQIILPGIKTLPCISLVQFGQSLTGDRNEEGGYLGKESTTDIQELEKYIQRKIKKPKADKLEYFKLHGSSNWYNNLQKNILVIGHSKSEKINQDDFLKKYHEMFNNALKNENSKILIIGYSFNDKHVNEMILSSKINVFLMYPSRLLAEISDKGQKEGVIIQGRFDLEKIFEGNDYECKRLKCEFFNFDKRFC